MPIWLRKFTFQNLKAHFEEISNNQKKLSNPKKQSFGPDIQPSFTSKSAKK
jgi:hypothetical protein